MARILYRSHGMIVGISYGARVLVYLRVAKKIK